MLQNNSDNHHYNESLTTLNKRSNENNSIENDENETGDDESIVNDEREGFLSKNIENDYDELYNHFDSQNISVIFLINFFIQSLN